MKRTKASRGVVRLVAMVIAMVGVGLVPAAYSGSASAAPGDVGYEDFHYGPGLTGSFIDPDLSPTASKPQSKLWFAQGHWWGVLQNPITLRFDIYSFNPASNTWTDTGVQADARDGVEQVDVLWVGGTTATLYVAGHGREGAGSKGIRVSQFTWSGTAWVAGSAQTINNSGVEEAVIARDTTGRLWVTYTSPADPGTRAVRVIVSDTSQSFTGAVPFTPPAPVTGTTISTDDISSINAHDGQVSLVWSNQIDEKVYVASHPDGSAPDAGWDAAVPLIAGSKAADDHIDIESVEGDSAGRVYVILKESVDDLNPKAPSDPLIRLLVLNAAGTAWASYTHSTVADDLTRPIVLLEPSARKIHVLATGPVEGGKIYEKTTSMDSISFAPGRGQEFISLAADNFVNNPTSTKQNITAVSGMLVLASDQKTGNYVHNYVPGPDTPPPPTANFTFAPASGKAPLDVTFTNTSTNTTGATWSWNFGDGSAVATTMNTAHKYVNPGQYTVTLTVTTAGGESTKTGTVTVLTPPTANFTAAPTSGDAPLDVTFTNTSTNATGATWSWDFGDGSPAATAKDPVHQYTAAGHFTVKLTATTAGGESTKTGTVDVGQPAAPVLSLGREPRFQSSRKVTVHWSTAGNGSGAVDVQRKVIRHNGSRWSTRVLGTTGSSFVFTGTPGATYCLRVRGHDTLDQPGAWSNMRCTAVPLDDRNLAKVKARAWHGAGPRSAYLHTVLRTGVKGAALVKRVKGKHVALIVTKARGAGSVRVYRGRALVKQVSLRSPRTRARVYVPIGNYSGVRTGTFRIVVVSRHRPVVIDGLAGVQEL